jgi:hypothetical protein
VVGIVVKLVRFLEKYKKAMVINWDAKMGIVMEMVKLLEWVSGKYKDMMEINWDSGMGIVVKLVRF